MERKCQMGTRKAKVGPKVNGTSNEIADGSTEARVQIFKKVSALPWKISSRVVR